MDVRIVRTENEHLITYRVEVFIDNEWQTINCQHGTCIDDEKMGKQALETQKDAEEYYK